MKILLLLLLVGCSYGARRTFVLDDSDSDTGSDGLPSSDFFWVDTVEPLETVERDDWVDLSNESEEVRVHVTKMIKQTPCNMMEDILRFGRKRVVSRLFVIFARSVLEDDDTPIEQLIGDTRHVIGAGTTQIYKTFMPAAAAVAGNVLRCPVGIVTKQCDNQKDLTDKLVKTYLPQLSQFKVATMSGSKAATKKIIREYSTTAFVMAATEPQIRNFLVAMSSLQRVEDRRTPPVHGWILVFDESDALVTTVQSEHKYEQALKAVTGKASWQCSADPPAKLSLHRPSVTLYETATPLPTMLRLRMDNAHVPAEHMFRLEPFPNYVSKRDYRPLQADGDDVWLQDGDLTVGNIFANHWKAELFIRDLAGCRNGLAVYLANSRVFTEKANIHTAWALREHAKQTCPGVPMVFAAYSAGLLRWFKPTDLYTPDNTYKPQRRSRSKVAEEVEEEADSAECHTRFPFPNPQEISIGMGEGKLTFGEAVDRMAEAAGSAAICIVAYSARRNVTWRTTRGYHNPRCQTHICNALPKSWDMPNYAQGNGRATGDSKELLETSTRQPGSAPGTGRNHITYLGHMWDHQADMATEAWVDEVCNRMHSKRLTLTEATVEDFPPICNFQLGRIARPEPKPTRKTLDRRYLFEYRAARPDIPGRQDYLPWRLKISPPDPREKEAREYVEGQLNKRRYSCGTTCVMDVEPHDPILTIEGELIAAAAEVAADVIEDNGRTASKYAKREEANLVDLEERMATVLIGEAAPPVLITEYNTFVVKEMSPEGALLDGDMSVEDALLEVQKTKTNVEGEKTESFGRVGAQVKQRHPCYGVRFCTMHNIPRLTRDIRTQQGVAPYNVSWRAYEDDGQVMVATIRYCDPLLGPSTQSKWVKDSLIQPAYSNRRLVWHTFDQLPKEEIKGKGNCSVQLKAPTIRVLTRGPLAMAPTAAPEGPPTAAPQGAPPTAAAGRQSKRQHGASLLYLLDAGVLQASPGSITTVHDGRVHTATLLEDGSIEFEGKVFKSPTAFRSAIRPGNSNGWRDVKYNGVALKVFKDSVRQ